MFINRRIIRVLSSERSTSSNKSETGNRPERADGDFSLQYVGGEGPNSSLCLAHGNINMKKHCLKFLQSRQRLQTKRRPNETGARLLMLSYSIQINAADRRRDACIGQRVNDKERKSGNKNGFYVFLNSLLSSLFVPLDSSPSQLNATYYFDCYFIASILFWFVFLISLFYATFSYQIL